MLDNYSGANRLSNEIFFFHSDKKKFYVDLFNTNATYVMQNTTNTYVHIKKIYIDTLGVYFQYYGNCTK